MAQPDAPEDAGLWQLQKDAFNQESTLAYLMNSNPYRDDPNFKPPSEEERLQHLTDRGLDPEHYAKFTGGSTSAQGYNRKLQNAQEDSERLRRLQGAGMTGAALQIANQFLERRAAQGLTHSPRIMFHMNTPVTPKRIWWSLVVCAAGNEKITTSNYCCPNTDRNVIVA